MQDQSNPSNESNPPVSEVVVLANNAGEEEALASNDDYALKPDRFDGRTIVSMDDCTLNTVSDESDKGSTLSARLSRPTSQATFDNTRSSSTLLTRYNLTYTGREIREELDKMTDEQIATKRKVTQLTLQSLGIDRKISGMRSEMTVNHQEAMTGQREILQRPAASTRASTASRLKNPSTSTQVLQSKIDKMTDEERQAARNTTSALMRTLETKVAVKSLHRDVTENHQEAMTGQREILKQHGELKTKMDEQPNDVADAVIERLAPILSRVIDRRRCEDSTPARREAHRRTPAAASRSSRRSEKRSRSPRYAVMSSIKAARIHGFDCHVRWLMGE